MKTVKYLLQGKGYDTWSVTPDTSVYDALALMADKNIGAVLVIDTQGDLAGIFSERDYARKVVLKGKTARETPVRAVMTEKVVCVRAEQSIEDCMALMTGKRIRHLPELDGNRLVGVISIGDVVKTIISEQEFIIEQLENYIVGSR
jgi:CBS domain-containing protein